MRLAINCNLCGLILDLSVNVDRSNTSSSALQTIGPASERERIALDISTLKHQYAKLRERQRQAHIILSGKIKFLL